MLTDMVACTKELLLEGKNVKIADLAIFSIGIKNRGGAEKESDFSTSANIRGVKFRARATGELMSKSLNLGGHAEESLGHHEEERGQRDYSAVVFLLQRVSRV